MAAGILTKQRGTGKYHVFGVLLDAAAAAGDGEWFKLDGKFPLTATVEGQFGGTPTVRILVSDYVIFGNEDAKPPNDVFRPTLGGDLTSNDSVAIDKPYRWVKATIPTWGSPTGTISVYLYGKTEDL